MPTDKQPSSDQKERFQNSFILQAWLVLTLALIFGIALAGVQASLGPKIEANKINETKLKIPEVLLGAAKAEKMARENLSLVMEPLLVSIEKNSQKKIYNVYKATFPNGELAGWVAKAKGQGYADKIELLVGFDPKVTRLTGLFILDQKETPGLGNKIIEKKWRGQFIQKSTNKHLKVVKTSAKTENEIDAITGATISSKSVAGIINTTVTDLKKKLAIKALENKKEK